MSWRKNIQIQNIWKEAPTARRERPLVANDPAQRSVSGRTRRRKERESEGEERETVYSIVISTHFLFNLSLTRKSLEIEISFSREIMRLN